MDEHPSRDITGSRGDELRGRRIVLCVSGSVAAYKAIELARLLARHGADVRCVESGAAARLVTPEYLRWATGNPVVTSLTGELEHVRLAERGMSDMVVAYPATANTIGKLANGIDDTAVSSVLTTALGSGIPVLVCPAMHESMYENPAVSRNVGFLRGRVGFLGPEMAEGKARAAEPEEALSRIIAEVSGGPLAGMRALVTAGATEEPIDPVRFVSARSTGTTGALVAGRLLRAGASVTLVWGAASAEPPAGAKVVPARTGAEMAAAVAGLAPGSDIIVMAAAVADYVPDAQGSKMPSTEGEISVRMRRAPKIIDGVRGMSGGAFIVAFKAGAGGDLEGTARKKLTEARADMVVANDVSSPEYSGQRTRGRVLLVDAGGTEDSGVAGMDEVAEFIVGGITRRMGRLTG